MKNFYKLIEKEKGIIVGTVLSLQANGNLLGQYSHEEISEGEFYYTDSCEFYKQEQIIKELVADEKRDATRMREIIDDRIRGNVNTQGLNRDQLRIVNSIEIWREKRAKDGNIAYKVLSETREFLYYTFSTQSFAILKCIDWNTEGYEKVYQNNNSDISKTVDSERSSDSKSLTESQSMNSPVEWEPEVKSDIDEIESPSEMKNPLHNTLRQPTPSDSTRPQSRISPPQRHSASKPPASTTRGKSKTPAARKTTAHKGRPVTSKGFGSATPRTFLGQGATDVRVNGGKPWPY
eukprot:GHVP01057143.1.p1 GENE.GHVP01057143.1~~GHVP01057143.1.p1  ORF type:complete len:292 (+),score=49.56 GHVP01057143.1:722-1597(+)